jgi:RNA polymerase sigma-70 factor (ECF subfamily)
VSVSETDRVFDELLVTLVQGGDRRARERLAARWQPRLIRTARRLLRDEDEAREAVQEAWLGISSNWLGLSDPARFPAWAFGILHRKCVDRVRAAGRRRSRVGSLDEADLPSIAAEGEDRTAIRRAFATLSAEHLAAAVLYFGEGLTLAEIAIATGVPLGTAKSRLFHARLALKTALKGDDNVRS